MDAVQVVGHLVIGLDDCLGAVPGAPIEVVGQNRRQRVMGALAPRHRLCLQDSGTHEGVAETNTQFVEAKEAGCNCPVEVVDTHALTGELGGRSEDLRELVSVVDSRNEENVARQ